MKLLNLRINKNFTVALTNFFLQLLARITLHPLKWTLIVVNYILLQHMQFVTEIQLVIISCYEY